MQEGEDSICRGKRAAAMTREELCARKTENNKNITKDTKTSFNIRINYHYNG